MTTTFQNGESASRSKWIEALSETSQIGASVLQDLSDAKTNTLLSFENGLIALNGSRQRAARALGDSVVSRFVLTDFLGVDQSRTSATIRADVSTATLKEKLEPVASSIKSIRFDSTSSSVEQFGDYYRVIEFSGRPTGTFLIEFSSVVSLNLVVFDLVTMPSQPELVVETSLDGLVYTSSQNVGLHGYRATAWIGDSVSCKYLRIQITPAAPDSLGGNSYTFGITQVNFMTSSFHLQSELVFLPQTVSIQSPRLRFQADYDGECTFYLSLNDGPAFGIASGQVFDVPGAASWVGTAVVEEGQLTWTTQQIWPASTQFVATNVLPFDLYSNTLDLNIEDDPTPVRLVRLDPDTLQTNRSPGQSPVTLQGRMTNAYICQHNRRLYYRPYQNGSTNLNRYDIRYVTGPSTLTVKLYVNFLSRDPSKTPIFRGAFIESIFEV